MELQGREAEMKRSTADSCHPVAARIDASETSLPGAHLQRQSLEPQSDHPWQVGWVINYRTSQFG